MVQPDLVQADSTDAELIAGPRNAISEQHYGMVEPTAAEVAAWFVHEELE